MEYVELRKLYYTLSQDEYTQTYHDRFHSEWATPIDFTIGGKPAFFLETPEVSHLVRRILKLDKDIALLKKDLPGVAHKQYSKKCLIDEILVTNNIEGVHSSRQELDETLAALEEQSTKKGKKNRFLGLMNKYLKLMSKEPVSLATCQDIRDIYDEIVLDEILAENKKDAPDGKIFRKDQTTIRSATDRVIHIGMSPESKIIQHMEKALAFLHDGTIEFLYRICIFHYLLEYIHPFYDGNGRLGRFILSYCITQELEPLLAYRLSETIKEDLKLYYTAFETCNDPHNLADLTPFLLMMLRMIERSAQELRDSLNRKLVRWERYRSLIRQFNSDMIGLYDLLIQAALFSEKGISTKAILGHTGVSRTTLKKRLDIIKKQHLLQCQKEGNLNFYQLDLSLLDDMLLEQTKKDG